MVGTIYGKQLSDSTNYKLIKNAYNDGKLEIMFYPRDLVYQVIRCPNNRVLETVEKEMNRLYPGVKRI